MLRAAPAHLQIAFEFSAAAVLAALVIFGLTYFFLRGFSAARFLPLERIYKIWNLFPTLALSQIANNLPSASSGLLLLFNHLLSLELAQESLQVISFNPAQVGIEFRHFGSFIWHRRWSYGPRCRLRCFCFLRGLCAALFGPRVRIFMPFHNKGH